jgi:hypothetical protein
VVVATTGDYDAVVQAVQELGPGRRIVVVVAASQQDVANLRSARPISGSAQNTP